MLGVTPPDALDAVSKRRYLYLALIAAGMAANYFKFPLFLNIDLLFGSIFAMLALQFFGTVRATLAAALIASITYFLWNHPYAALILTIEVAVVGTLMQRGKMGMVLADTLYWLLLGIPLVYLTYRVVMQSSMDTTTLTLTKQAVNGIANAVIARLIFIGMPLRATSAKVPFREVLYNLMAFFVLFPALLILAIGSRADFNDSDRQIRASLHQQKDHISDILSGWVNDRKSAVDHLAEIATIRSPQQMQAYLELVKKADSNLLRIGLANKEAIMTAYFPQVDELGQSNIGRNFSDRSYLQQLKQTLKPQLTEVFMARVGIPQPMVMIVAPVLSQGTYNGYVTGILNLNGLKSQLDRMVSDTASHYTLVDRNSQVILTNRLDQTVMTAFRRSNGVLNPLDSELSQWVPLAQINKPISERWKNSFYVIQADIGDLSDWNVILEQPVAPFQQALFANYTDKLTLVFAILLGALALAELLSRQIVSSLEQLRAITRRFTLGPDTPGQHIDWPKSVISQTHDLIEDFKSLSTTLHAKFHEIEQVNATLDARVKERTQELTLSEGRFRRFFEDNASVMLLIDPSTGKIEQANAAALTYYGYTSEQLHKLSISDLNALSEAEITAEMQLARHQQRGYFIFRHRLASGNARDVEVYSTPVDVAGQSLLFSIIHDITERRRATDATEMQRARFQTILRNATDGIHIVDRAGNLLEASDSFCHMLGYSYLDMKGMNIGQWDAVLTPGDLATALAHQFTLTQANTFETRHRRKDGSTFEVEISGYPMELDGQIVLFNSSRDISERKAYQLALERAKTEAEAANLAKSRFLATMSHEIRTPMNGILGMAQLLLEPNVDDSHRKSYTQTILTSGQSLMALLNDILDLSKIEAGKYQIDAVVIEPHALLQDIQTLFCGAAQVKHLQLDSQWRGPYRQRYRADAHRLRQMLSNLVGNAIKFTQEGYIRVEGREFGRDQNMALLEFSVTDSGVGVAADKLALLFKPFSQSDSSITREYGGSGLGLSIVRNLAKAMGGEVGVVSEPGQGSTFWFRIRAVIADAEVDRHPMQPANANVTPLPTEQFQFAGQVLVVEDNTVNCMVITSMLSRLGLSHQVVSDGQQAVDALQGRDQPDLVLMDIHMPVMDGYQATALIRQGERNTLRQRTPIVALTADAFEEDHQHCLAVGMDDFLTKPIGLDALKRSLSKWLPTVAQAVPSQRLNHTPVDTPAFVALVADITPLLQHNKSSAIPSFEKLKNLVTGTILEDEIAALEAPLQNLRFDLVLAQLNLLEARHVASDDLETA